MYRAKRVDTEGPVRGDHFSFYCSARDKKVDYIIIDTVKDRNSIMVEVAGSCLACYRVIPDTLEIKIGGHWFKPDDVKGIVEDWQVLFCKVLRLKIEVNGRESVKISRSRAAWILPYLEGIDSPEVQDLREILAEKE